MIYVYPKLAKFDLCYFGLFGSGLGNKLLPWARAVLCAKHRNWPILWPNWAQMKIGPFLRNEYDKRTYIGLFKNNGEYISGLKKLYILSKFQSYPEEILKEDFKIKNGIVEFYGLKDRFSSILGKHDFIKKELMKIILPKHKIGLNYDFGKSISVHIRRGDFAIPKTRKLLKEGKWNYQIPISWYIEKIEQIRSFLSKNIPCYIFSDGNYNEIKDVLDLKNTKRMTFGSSITDILVLSNSNLLIASGSSFSQWACYLGQMPSIWYTGQKHENIAINQRNSNYQIESGEGDQLPFNFLKLLEELF